MSYFRRTRIIYAAIVALALFLGYATLTGWAVALVFGLLLVVFGVYARRMAVAHVAAKAAPALQADDPDAAHEVLERARAEKVPLDAAPLIVASLRAEIALMRGQLDDVRRIVDEGLARPRSRLDPVSDRTSRRALSAVGAIARAAADDHDGALAAAASVEADADADVRALSRATLARAIVFARTSRREELGALLRERQTLLDLGTTVRERSLARAFARLARSPASSVYRRSAKEAGAQKSDWVDAAAGDAAELVGRREAVGAPIAARTEQAGKLPRSTIAAKRHVRRVLALWVVMVALFLAAFQILPRDGALAHHTPTHGGGMETSFLPFGGRMDIAAAAVVLLMGVFVFNRIRSSMRRWDRTTRLVVTYARGAEAEAMSGLTAIAGEQNAALSAHASLALTTLATRRGDATAARVAATQGLGRLARREMRLATADLLYPELVAQWAYALAAEGDAAAARKAIAAMPEYARAVRSRFRVELLARWREGDEAGAAEWAQRGERDNAIGADDEILADAIRVAVSGDGLSGNERARIREEVGDPRWRRFLDGVAPGLVERVLASAAADDASGMPDADAEEDDVAEREAAAEEEALARVGVAAART